MCHLGVAVLPAAPSLYAYLHLPLYLRSCLFLHLCLWLFACRCVAHNSTFLSFRPFWTRPPRLLLRLLYIVMTHPEIGLRKSRKLFYKQVKSGDRYARFCFARSCIYRRFSSKSPLISCDSAQSRMRSRSSVLPALAS